MTFTKPYLVPLRKIKLAKGNVFHALKSNENSFKGFGELYFSRIEFGKIKGWRRHNKYTLNLIVIEGLVKFIVASNDTFETDNPEYLEEFVIGPSENYKRLVVPPGHWMAFKGIGRCSNIIANVIDGPHDPEETDSKDFSIFEYAFN